MRPPNGITDPVYSYIRSSEKLRSALEVLEDLRALTGHASVPLGLRAVIDTTFKMCHIGHMKTISIRELHTFTGRYIRQAMNESLVVTERGRPVAIVKKIEEVDMEGVPLPNRETWIARIPRTDLDSTQIVSDDRERA